MILVTLATASKEDLKRRANKHAVVWLVLRRGGCEERTHHAPHSSHCSAVVTAVLVPWIPLKQVPPGISKYPQVPWTDTICTFGLHGCHGCHGGLLYDT